MSARDALTPEAQMIVWLTQLADCFSFLAKKRVLHRDLKPDNILLDKHANVKVTPSATPTPYGSRV